MCTYKYILYICILSCVYYILYICRLDLRRKLSQRLRLLFKTTRYIALKFSCLNLHDPKLITNKSDNPWLITNQESVE